MTTPRILIVDDSVSIRNIIKIYMMQFRAEFLEAEDGDRALKLARLMLPALIIADVNMPGMDGISLVEHLRKESGPLCQVPIILLTGEREPEIQQRGIAAGADAFIQKPVSAPVLLETVQKLLPRE